MFVRKSAIRQFGCNGKPCIKERKECVIEPPFDDAVTRRVLTGKLLSNSDFYMPLREVESAYRYPSGNVKTIQLAATLIAISFSFDLDVEQVPMVLGIVVSDLHPAREEGDLETVGVIKPGCQDDPLLTRIQLIDMNTNTVLMLLANHEFAFRV